jgi:outer membrane murein-binding lipoprotein Lpp
MPRNGRAATVEGESTQPLDAAAQALLDGGRTVVDQLPQAVDGARGAIQAAKDRADRLSDQGVVAAVAFSLGVTLGLALAGAPRAILALALVPAVITVQSASDRGLRPSLMLA